MTYFEHIWILSLDGSCSACFSISFWTRIFIVKTVITLLKLRTLNQKNIWRQTIMIGKLWRIKEYALTKEKCRYGFWLQISVAVRKRKRLRKEIPGERLLNGMGMVVWFLLWKVDDLFIYLLCILNLLRHVFLKHDWWLVLPFK